MITSNKAVATWFGSSRQGHATLTLPSGALGSDRLTFGKRFEDEPGTNPEELIAAAHAGCYSMALAVLLEQEGFTAERLETTAVVTLEKIGDGFGITHSELNLVARVPGIEQPDFADIAERAKNGCPVSKLLNAGISLQWSLL